MNKDATLTAEQQLLLVRMLYGWRSWPVTGSFDVMP